MLSCCYLAFFSVDRHVEGAKAMVNQTAGTLAQIDSSIELYQLKLCSSPTCIHRKNRKQISLSNILSHVVKMISSITF